MAGENDKLINGSDAAGGEEITPLFSAFRPKPRPAPARAETSSKPASQEKPAVPPLETRLAGLEKKLQEAAEREDARGPEKQMLDYLKVKTAELEEKLRDSQKKAMEFAYELKGREDARKESHREMEEFLAAVKHQQSAAETERLRALELERSRQRIEALEQKLVEISSAGLLGRIDELARKIEAVFARLDALEKSGIALKEGARLLALIKTDIAEMFRPILVEPESKPPNADKGPGARGGAETG